MWTRNTVASSSMVRSCSTHIRRGDRTQGYVDHAKGLWRRLLRDELAYIGADLNFAWPTAEIAVMGPDGAVNIIFQREAAGADDPVAKKDELVADYKDKFANPYRAAELGYVDEILLPRDTCPVGGGF